MDYAFIFYIIGIVCMSVACYGFWKENMELKTKLKLKEDEYDVLVQQTDEFALRATTAEKKLTRIMESLNTIYRMI